jgi:hypothetical protein
MAKSAIVLLNNTFQFRIKKPTDIFWFLRPRSMISERYAVNTKHSGTPIQFLLIYDLASFNVYSQN